MVAVGFLKIVSATYTNSIAVEIVVYGIVIRRGRIENSLTVYTLHTKDSTQFSNNDETVWKEKNCESHTGC